MRTTRISALLLGLCFLVSLATTSVRMSGQRGGAPAIDNDDIGGVVIGVQGPEAGVWVIAETRSTPTRLIKSVVTDDRGRYVIPDLPAGEYDVWVRGYGLVDSAKVKSAPGKVVNLKAVAAPDKKAAVVLNITTPGFDDWRQDATCIIRPQSLIGEQFVECTPTEPRGTDEQAPPPLKKGRVGLKKPAKKGRVVTLHGTVSPAVTPSSSAVLVIQVRKLGTKQKFHRLKKVRAREGNAYKLRVKLKAGKWKLRVRYQAPGVITAPVTSRAVSVSVR